MWLLDILDKLLTGDAAMDGDIYDEWMVERARGELGIIDDPYEEWATKSEHQWRERAKSMQAKDKCLWCTTPYEDESGSCTKCGAPKDIEEVVALKSSTSYRPWLEYSYEEMQ